MRPYGTSTQLAQRRERALSLLRDGQSVAQVAKRVGITERSIRRWKHLKRQPKHNRRTLGRPCRLSPTQCQRLLRILEQGAYRQGYPEDYWTLDRITHVIWDLFRVRYQPSGVWRLMHRLGWSCQKPQRRPFHRNDEAVGHWKQYLWPRIKKVAAA